jgi:modification methylase
VRAARSRIASVTPTPAENLAVTGNKKDEPRIPFGHVIEAGFVNPGDILVSPDGHHRARVRADGSLVAGDYSGSIHRVGALVANAPACNGWTYWHVEQPGRGREPIDLFRREARRRMAASA